MKQAMTSKERLIAAIRRQPVDYVPCVPNYNDLTAAQRAGHKWQFPWKLSTVERIQYNVEVLGVDQRVSITIPFKPNQCVKAKTWIEGDTLHKAYETPAGSLHAAAKMDERWPHGNNIPLYTDFVSHFSEPWIKSEQDIKSLRYILQPPQSADDIASIKAEFTSAKQLADRFNLAICAGIGTGLTGALQLFGAEALCLTMVDHPEWVEEYLAIDHDLNMKKIEMSIDMGADIISRNGFYETADFYGPTTLEHFLKPNLQAEFHAVHQAGKVVVYTMNTGIMPIIDYVNDLDFDCVTNLEIVPAFTDLEVVHDKLSSKKSFWTGPSNTYHMWSDDPEVVRQAVRDVFSVLGRQGLIITASPSTHCIMPWENTLAMIDEWKKLR